MELFKADNYETVTITQEEKEVIHAMRKGGQVQVTFYGSNYESAMQDSKEITALKHRTFIDVHGTPAFYISNKEYPLDGKITMIHYIEKATHGNE